MGLLDPVGLTKARADALYDALGAAAAAGIPSVVNLGAAPGTSSTVSLLPSTVKQVLITLNANHTMTVPPAVGPGVKIYITQPHTGGPFVFTLTDGSAPQTIPINSTADGLTVVFVESPDGASLKVSVLGGLVSSAPSGPAGGDLGGTFPNPSTLAVHGVAADAVTSKGDLLVSNATPALKRQGVGSDGQVLTADSTQTTGVKWAAAGGGVQSNFAAVTDPTTANDGTQGYAVGSVWINTLTRATFRCYSASTGAAVWIHTSSIWYFGDGSDGAVTFDGTTTILGMAPVANVYTLTRDIFASTLVINTGVTIVTAGHRISASVSATNNGTIGSAGTAGGATGTLGAATTSSTIGGGFAGGAGNTGVGSAAGAGTVGVGGAGGTSGASGGNNLGGSAATGLANSITNGLKSLFLLPAAAALGAFQLTSTVRVLGGGTGGGGGGGDGTNKGGGGGSGGPAIVIFTPVFTNNGTLLATGGAGGTPTTGNAGGGAGGSGGFVLIYTLTAATMGTVTLTGGTGGTGVGTGANGGNGGAGSSLNVVLT